MGAAMAGPAVDAKGLRQGFINGRGSISLGEVWADSLPVPARVPEGSAPVIDHRWVAGNKYLGIDGT